jgi:hypothetical protein
MKKLAPIILLLLIVAFSGCTGSKSTGAPLPDEIQNIQPANPNLNGKIVDVKLVPSDIRAGENVTANLVITNAGNENITNESVEIRSEAETLDDTIANLALKFMGDDKKTRTIKIDFDENITPGTVKPISAYFQTQQQMLGRNLAGMYQITITLYMNGQKVDAKIMPEIFHSGTPREFTPIPTPPPTPIPALTPTSEPIVIATPTGVINVTRIMNNNFGEPNKQINAGDALEWNNYDDDTFTLVEMNQKMANITVRRGGRTTYIFNTTGTYKFGLFYNGMRGDPNIQTIVVKVNETDQILNKQIFDQIRKISGVNTS